jgi:large subunit ribosomal protein L23
LSEMAQRTILYPLVSEDSVSLVEKENKITLVVDLKASKGDIKRAVEALYEVKVEKVNVCITPEGIKKAFVKLNPEYKASELAVKLGIL